MEVSESARASDLRSTRGSARDPACRLNRQSRQSDWQRSLRRAGPVAAERGAAPVPTGRRAVSVPTELRAVPVPSDVPCRQEPQSWKALVRQAPAEESEL